MIRYVLAVVLIFQGTTWCFGEVPDAVTFHKTGYEIDIIDSGPAQSGMYEAFKMILPPKDGFASNINVQHQAFSGDLQDYAAISRSQVKFSGLKIENEKMDESGYRAEAVGKVLGIEIELHFYFHAIKVGDNVILATATAPQSRWDIEKDVLVPVIDSLKPVAK